MDDRLRVVFFGELGSTFSRLHYLALRRKSNVLLWVASRQDSPQARSSFKSARDWWQRFQVRARFEFQVVRYWGKPFAFLNHINVPIRYAQRNDPELATALNILKPDLIVSAGYRWLLPKSVLAIPKLGAFNCHPSPLPRYAGSNPWFWILANGETESAVTIHRMVDAADAGNIVRQRFFPIAPTANHQQLYNESSVMSARLLEECLDAWAKGIVEETPQDLAHRSFFPLPQDDDYRIDWHRTAVQICNLVRASSPAPGAWAMFRGRRLIVREISSVEGRASPGKVCEIIRGLSVGCSDGIVLIREIILDERVANDTNTIVRELGIKVGDVFE